MALPGLVRDLALTNKLVSLTAQPDFEISIMVYLMLKPPQAIDRPLKATFALPWKCNPTCPLTLENSLLYC